MALYALMGITGNVGSAAGRALLGEGERIRAVVRERSKSAPWSAQGAEVAVATIDDAAALQASFSGVDGVFVMLPTWIEADDILAEARRAIRALGEALRGARVPKVVLLSAIGAQYSHGTGAALKFHALETALSDLPALASVRAAYFMENYAGLIGAARNSGLLPSLLQPVDRAVPMVSVADVGRQVADTLRKNWIGQQVIELEGPQRYTPNDVASVLTEILGRPVKAESVPREHWDPVFRSMGFTAGSSKAVSEMIDGFNSWIQFERTQPTIHGTTLLQTVLAALAKASGS